ncbi:MAG: 3-methyl-2-oxobutanoate hydroxymethyltransferase [Halobacteriovoraceae bacterium]|nr:3-methyl-2-oxobutanoate hydroxymethyltransferase [Halobacteriovoraceae bacterium]|tara:strand:- start:10098 stop:10919 length:822 start_codon:yes stop_codon:yes gene_type:complete
MKAPSLNKRKIKKRKLHKGAAPLSMLTAYDFQTAQLLDQTELDMILVGDSVGNVVLGYDTTVEVTLNDMITFGAAVKRGAPSKFTVIDLPFGSYATIDKGLESAIEIFQKTKAEAVKLEGASPIFLELITRLTEVGIPVMGHIGLTPQSVHQQGGYYVHGKTNASEARIYKEAMELEKAGCFAIVLEFVEETLAQRISENLKIPTVGIGSGQKTDGQVLVINDLLKLGPNQPPSFCKPMADLFEVKKEVLNKYLARFKNEENSNNDESNESLH